MKHIITLLLLAATVASAEKPVEVYRSGYIRVVLIVVEGHKYLLFDGLEKGGITHAESCTNHAPTIVTQSCQRTHCDTPAPMPMPWGFTNQHPIITLPYIVGTNDSINRWLNQPNTWPGTYSTNYVTNINANVEKEN